MATTTSYTNARASLARLLNRVSDDRDIVIIQRRGREDVAMIAADELAGVMETVHLLRSPANRTRLLCALARAKRRTGRPGSVAELRREVGLGEK